MGKSYSASYSGRVTPPGYPKMQSTFSRTRHSSRIWEPDISFDSVTPLVRCAVVVDIFPPNQTRRNRASKNQKGHQVVFFPHPMAFRKLMSEALKRGWVRRPQ